MNLFSLIEPLQYGFMVEAMLIAALGAEGESHIKNIGQIERGYERIDARLRELGAAIERSE